MPDSAALDPDSAALDRSDASPADVDCTSARFVTLLAPQPHLNVSVLRDSLEHITENPEQHDQYRWDACIAYHAATIAGHSNLDYGCDCLICIRGAPRHVAQVARQALGLSQHQADQLFRGSNSLDDLWRLAGEFTNGAVTRTSRSGGAPSTPVQRSSCC